MSKSKLGLAIFSLGLLLCMPFTQVKAGISTFLGESDGLTGVYAFRPDGTDVSCRKADQTIITDISQVLTVFPNTPATRKWESLTDFVLSVIKPNTILGMAAESVHYCVEVSSGENCRI